jgi:hypothetical protein
VRALASAVRLSGTAGLHSSSHLCGNLLHRRARRLSAKQRPPGRPRRTERAALPRDTLRAHDDAGRESPPRAAPTNCGRSPPTFCRRMALPPVIPILTPRPRAYVIAVLFCCWSRFLLRSQASPAPMNIRLSRPGGQVDRMGFNNLTPGPRWCPIMIARVLTSSPARSRLRRTTPPSGSSGESVGVNSSGR